MGEIVLGWNWVLSLFLLLTVIVLIRALPRSSNTSSFGKARHFAVLTHVFRQRQRARHGSYWTVSCRQRRCGAMGEDARSRSGIYFIVPMLLKPCGGVRPDVRDRFSCLWTSGWTGHPVDHQHGSQCMTAGGPVPKTVQVLNSFAPGKA
jgi:hypothetical protein